MLSIFQVPLRGSPWIAHQRTRNKHPGLRARVIKAFVAGEGGGDFVYVAGRLTTALIQVQQEAATVVHARARLG